MTTSLNIFNLKCYSTQIDGKQLKKQQEQDGEIRQYEEKIHNLVNQMIPID